MTQIETPSNAVFAWRAAILVLGAILLATEVFERPEPWERALAHSRAAPPVIYRTLTTQRKKKKNKKTKKRPLQNP